MANTYYRAAVGAFIVNEDGKLLVILKHNYGNKWDIVKGGIDEGETELAALKRELWEELGIDAYEILLKSKIASVKISPDFDGGKREYIGQARNNYWIFVSKKTKFKIPNQEIEKCAWINISPGKIQTYFNIHDEEKVLTTLLPLEWRTVMRRFLPR